MTSFSLGVIFHPKFPPETLIDYARRAEKGGFDELWLWEDCFWAGAMTSAAVVLASTERIKVGIGLMPVTIRNPLFFAMEITTLARLYPGRFIPGFGHGVDAWMKQIGAAAPSSLKAIDETVTAVRGLLNGDDVTLHGSYVNLDHVQMLHTSSQVPPLYVGAMREKTLQLAGRVGDGTILTEMSSPAYVRWALEHVRTGMQAGQRTTNTMTVFTHAKVGEGSREAVRSVIGRSLSWTQPHLQPLGIADEAAALLRDYGAEAAAARLPEAWLDELSISGTPDQAAAAVHRLAEAGAGSIVLQPLDGDPSGLDGYINTLLPALG